MTRSDLAPVRTITPHAAQARTCRCGGAVAWPQPASAQTKPPTKPTGQVIVGISQEPTVFNPLLLHIEVDEGVYMNLFSPLWSVDPAGHFVPELVSEVPTVANGGVSPDGRNWRLKLRSGVTWHDGAPFTAEDVKYTIDLINNHDFPAASRAGHELVRDITILSPTEIAWRMEKPFAPYPRQAVLRLDKPDALHRAKAPSGQEADIRKPKFASSPIGTGPFTWGERAPGDHVTLVANEKYYGAGPYVERLVFKYIPDLTVLYTQFRTGDVDYVDIQGITADHYAEAKNLKDRKVYVAPLPFVETFDSTSGGRNFRSSRCDRRCTEHRQGEHRQGVYYGLQSPTESFLPTQTWTFNPNLPKQHYKPDGAKKLLDEAGWKLGADGVRKKNGVRLEFTNSTTAGNQLREQVQQLFQQNWQDLGMKMTIKNMPPAVMCGDYWMQSQFDSGLAGIDFMSGPDPECSDYLRSTSTPAKGGSGQNTFQYVSPEVDKLLKEAGETPDQAARAPLYQRIQAVVRDDLPFLPLFQYSLIKGAKAKLMGYTSNVNIRSNC